MNRGDSESWRLFDFLTAHLTECKKRARYCLPCRLVKKIKASRPWLEAKATSNKFTVGCGVCSRNGLASSWGRIDVTSCKQLTTQALDRHESSKHHKGANGDDEATGSRLIDGKLAPGSDIFTEVLDIMETGEQSTGKIASRLTTTKAWKKGKIQRLKWCLAEGRRRMFREFFFESRMCLNRAPRSAKTVVGAQVHWMQ